MAGPKREARLRARMTRPSTSCRVPKTWMPGTSPGMTTRLEVGTRRRQSLLRNRLHYAADRAAGNRRHLLVLYQHRIVFRQGFELLLGLHLHDLVAAGLQATQQRRQGDRRVLLQIVHQDDALALLVELGHDVVDD